MHFFFIPLAMYVSTRGRRIKFICVLCARESCFGIVDPDRFESNCIDLNSLQLQVRVLDSFGLSTKEPHTIMLCPSCILPIYMWRRASCPASPAGQTCTVAGRNRQVLAIFNKNMLVMRHF